MSKLSVLVHGRREAVSVTPSTLLHAVLDEVCRRHQLDAAVHALRPERGGAPLDLSAPFRLSGLANNARLELVAAVARPGATALAGECRVGVQLDDGTRFVGQFALDTTLASVLAWAGSDAAAGRKLAPALSYAAHAVEGEEALCGTTLRRLGAIASGSILLRARTATPSAERARDAPAAPAVAADDGATSMEVDAMEVDGGEGCAALELERPAAPVACITAASTLAPEPLRALPLSPPSPQPPLPPPTPRARAADGAADGAADALVARAAVDAPGSALDGRGGDGAPLASLTHAASATAHVTAAAAEAEALGQLFEQRRALAGPLSRMRAAAGGGGGGAADFALGVRTLRSLVANVLRAPDEPKFRMLRPDGAAVHQRLGRLDGSMDALRACGWEVAPAHLLCLPVAPDEPGARAQAARLSASLHALDALADAFAGAVQAAPGPLQAAPGPLQAAPGPLQAAPGPLQAAPGPLQAAPGPLQAAPGPLQAAPGPLQAAPGPLQAAPGPLEPRAAVDAPAPPVPPPPSAPPRAPAAGLTLTEARVAALRARKEDVRADAGCERRLALFRTSGRSLQGAIRAAEELSDDFYEVRAHDLGGALGGADGACGGGAGGSASGAGCGGAARAAPMLQTPAMRELARLERLAERQCTVIRLRLSTEHMLQAHFHPQEPISRLVDLLTEHVLLPAENGTDGAADGAADGARGGGGTGGGVGAARWQLRLHIAPPLRVLHLDRSFAQEALVPAALVHASWEAAGCPVAGGAANRIVPPPPLPPPLRVRAELLASAAELPADQPMHERPARVGGTPAARAESAAAAAERRALGATVGLGGGSGGGGDDDAPSAPPASRPGGKAGKPKWLKL